MHDQIHSQSAWPSKPDRSRFSADFTLIELLVVIVVIAILATIVIVTFGGIRQRAENTAIITAARESYSRIVAYIQVTGAYPATISDGSVICITRVSGCQTNLPLVSATANDAFDAEVATIGNLPRSVPNAGPDRNGVMYW